MLIELLCILLIIAFICSIIFCAVGKMPFGRAFLCGIGCALYAFMTFMIVGLLLFIFAREFSKTTAADIVLLSISAVVAMGTMRDEIRIWKELNIEIGHHLPHMRMFAEDFSHFLPGYHRVLNIYYDKEKSAIMVWMYVIDGTEPKRLYEVMDKDAAISTSGIDINKNFFSDHYEYSQEWFRCIDLLIHGEEMDDVSNTLSYKTTFIYCGGESFSELAREMAKSYPKEFKKSSPTWFSLTFSGR